MRIDSLAKSLDVRMDELRDASLVIRKLQLENAGVSGPNSDTHQLKISELEQATTNLNSYISLLRAGQRLLQRAMDESSASLAPANSQVFLSSLAYWTKAVWNYEIAVVDDRSLTVGKILSALGLLLGSILLARLLSRLLGTRLLPRLGVNEAGARHLADDCLLPVDMLLCIHRSGSGERTHHWLCVYGWCDCDRCRIWKSKHYQQFYQRIDSARRAPHSAG